MTKEMIYGIIIFATLMGLIVGFLVMLILDSYTSKKRKKIYVAIIALTFVLVMQNFIEFYLTVYTKERFLRTCFAVLGYSIRPAIIVLYAYLFRPDKKHFVACGLVAFNALMHATAFIPKIDIVFGIDERNVYYGGSLYALCYVVCFILLAYLAGLGLSSYKGKKFNLKEVIFHLFWIGIIILGMICDMLWGSDRQWVSYVTISVIIAVVYSYIWLHQRFVSDYEVNFMAEQRLNMMITQIQPHFIYNSLSAIAEIEGVPEKAQKEIVNFSTYLRENLDAMTTAELVPFEKEIGHIKKYVDLEILRFGEKVNVVFDLNCNDFLLPALTVQMLVENAIKHGITKRYEGGTVTISSEKTGGNVVITVKDDGVGFNTKKKTEGNHIGINNIRKRLEYMVGGTLEVESEEGIGTTATVVMPFIQKENKQ